MRNAEDITTKIIEIIQTVDKTEESRENGEISKGTYIKRRGTLDVVYEVLMWAAGNYDKINLDY